MTALPIKKIIEFNRKSSRSKKTFVANLQKEKTVKKSTSGGDYWVTSLSTLGTSYKLKDTQFILDKIAELEEKKRAAKFKSTRDMHSRNIDILENYLDFDIRKWRPLKDVSIEKGGHVKAVINVHGIDVEVRPTYVIKYEKDEHYSLGAIWFIAQLGGFSKAELGMFTEMLYKFVVANFEKEDIKINPKYCIAVDAYSKLQISYQQIQNGEVERTLETVLDEIQSLM